MTLAFLEHQPAAYHAQILSVLDRGVVEMAILLHLDFASAPLRICNRMTGFTDLDDGHEWDSGGGLLVALPDLDDDGSLAPLRGFALGMPQEQITGADWRGDMVDMVGDVTEYRKRDYGLYGQLFSDGQPLGYPFSLDIGLMDRMSASFTPGGAVLSLSCEGLLARRGSPVYGMQTYQDQKRLQFQSFPVQFVTESGRLITWTDW